MQSYKREILNAPENLVDNGLCNFGTYDSFIKNINILSAKKPFKIPVPKVYKYLRLKEWQAFQANNSRIFMLGTIYNSKVLGLILLSIYDKKLNKHYYIKKLVPLCKVRVGSGMYDSESSYTSSNLSMKITNKLVDNRINIEATHTQNEQIPRIDLNIECFHTTKPIVICHPLGENRPLYSHKALMPIKGVLIIDGECIAFDISDSCAVIDDHKGYYPKHLKYDWITGMGYIKDGILVGFNLTDNQVLDKGRYNENCLWINGEMIALAPIKVERECGDTDIWRIKDKYNMVDLRFYPQVKNDIEFKFMHLFCDYEGPFGVFKGYIRVKNNVVRVDNFYGMGEKKECKI